MATAGDIAVNLVAYHQGLQRGLQQGRDDVRRFSRGAADDIARSGRAQQAELAEVRRKIDYVTSRYQAQGKVGGAELSMLVQREHRLTQAIDQRSAMVDRARMAIVREGQAAETAATQHKRLASSRGGFGGGGLGARGLGVGLAFGLSDALSAGMYGGFRGAALGAANNLPMISEGLGEVAKRSKAATGAFGGLVMTFAKLAGPAGLIASVALPLTALLVPALLSGESAAEKMARRAKEVEEQLARIKKSLDDQRRFEAAAEGKANIGGQKQTVDELRQEMEALQRQARQLNTAGLRQEIRADNNGLWGFVTGEEGQVEETFAKLRAVQEKMAALRKRLATEERILAEAEADKTLKERARKKIEARMAEISKAAMYQERADKEAAAKRAAYYREEQEKRAAREDNMQRSVLQSLGGKWRQLQEQRRTLLQSRVGQETFRGATATRFENSMDRIAEMINARRTSARNAEQDRQLDALDEQIRLLEKLVEIVRGNEGNGLQPAGIG